MGFLINNIQDVAEKIWGTTVHLLERDVYKNTDCGAWIRWSDDCVQIGSIVEGSDAEFDRTFKFPFDSDEMESWIDELETLTDEAWREANTL